jgi:hypothetical protein
LRPRVLALGVLAAGTLVAPWISHRFDVQRCFLGWARATGGTAPWEVYAAAGRGLAPVDCDYPPVVPYFLTLVEAARLAASAAETGPLAVALVKLPSLLAWAAAVVLCARLLAPVFGGGEARRAAVFAALCAPLFVNAAVWGQFDGLVAVLILTATALLLAGRAAAAGAVFGAALATKVLGAAALPVAAVWTLRRLGARSLLRAVAAGALVLLVLSTPYVLAGRGRDVARAYTHAVDYYSRRTMEAYNVWYLLDRAESRWGPRPPAEVRRDDRPALGPLTYRDLGLGAFAAYVCLACAMVWRRPEREALVLGAAMSLFAFFMLPTQIHGRYLTAAVPVLAAVAARSRAARVLFVALSATAAGGQLVELWRSILEHWHRLDPAYFADIRAQRGLVRGAAVLLGVANVALFVWGTAAVRREVAAASPRS